MVTQSIPIPYRSDEVQGTLGRDINSFIPSRVQTAIYNACLSQPLLVLVSKYDIRIAQAVDVASFQILRLDNFDREDETLRTTNPPSYRRLVTCNNICTCVDINLVF